MNTLRKTPTCIALTTALLLMLPGVPAWAGGGKLLLTGGVSTIDGAAGVGLTPWAVTGSDATQGEWGATAHATTARTGDHGLTGCGAAVSHGDRLALSIARQNLDTRDNLAPLGLAGLHLKLDIVGLKLRLAGDAVLDSDSWMPQFAVGPLHKRADVGALEPTLCPPGPGDRPRRLQPPRRGAAGRDERQGHRVWRPEPTAGAAGADAPRHRDPLNAAGRRRLRRSTNPAFR